MKILVTGGAGFTGRWVVKKLLELGHEIFVLDNLSNGSKENLSEFTKNRNYKGLFFGDIKDKEKIVKMFSKEKFNLCIHLAANINVQKSISSPFETIETNIIGTFNLLEVAKKYNTKFVFISSALVYDTMKNKPIDEGHATRAACPYMASKLAGEQLSLSYYHAYGLPVVILRPFSIYGPFQKGTSEGGVVSIFIKNKIEDKKLEIYGDGTQTRDFFYVEDCADFIVRAAFSEKANGEIINAGSGKDISIKELAKLIAKDDSKIIYVKHHHPQAEVQKMVCDSSKAEKLLGCKAKISLEEGLKKTEDWLKNNE